MAEKCTIQQAGLLNPQGMALVLCLLLMSILCLVGGAALGISGLNHKIVHNGAKQTQAFYLAEAGRQTALGFLNGDPLWRGDAASGSYEGGLSFDGVSGSFTVSLSDCTADENGVYNGLLPAGCVLLESTGTWLDSVQRVRCIVRLSSVETQAASFPGVAVLSSGPVTGSLTALDDLGDENAAMVQTPATLPAGNIGALKALAAAAFSSLDNDVWDSALDDVTSFWLDPATEIRPRILCVSGDLALSGDRQLYGIVYVAGEHIAFEGASGVQGVLYAPNATDAAVHNTGASGRIAVTGVFITGAGGVAVSGNAASFMYHPDYVAAFNIAAGQTVDVDLIPGNWSSF